MILPKKRLLNLGMNNDLKESPLVSIRLMTYNHAAYIEQALQGIDMQKTNFNFEVVVGDDFSTDGNLDRVKAYRFLNKKISVKILDRIPGDAYSLLRKKNGRLHNFVDIINNCSGKYIALLDGDDYWTDPLKLQKQVDFMEGNLEYGICFHNVLKVNDFNNKLNSIPGVKKDTDFTISDYVLNNKTAACSIFFKNNVFEAGILKWFSKLPFGDLGLVLIVLKKCNGKGRVLKDEMGVYRIHENGIHGSFHENNQGLIKAYEQHLLFTKIIARHLLFETKYESVLRKKKIITFEKISTLSKQTKNYNKFLEYKFLTWYSKIITKIFPF